MSSRHSASTERSDEELAGGWLDRRLYRTVEPLADLSLLWVLVLPVVPVGFTALVVTAGFVAHRGGDPGWPEWTLLVPLGVAYVAVLGWLFARWDGETRRAAAVVRTPSTNEVLAAITAALLGVAVVVVGNNLAVATGLSPHERAGVTTTAGVAAMVFTTLLVAPVVEEVLFRGVVLGHLLGRGFGILAASLVSIVLFALVHVFMAGVTSLVVAGAIGVLLTALRLRYDNLVGAWLTHLLINVWGLLIAVGVLPVLW